MNDRVTISGESPWCYSSEKSGLTIKVFETGDIEIRVFRVPTSFQLKDGKLFVYRRHEDGPLSAYGGNPPEDARIATIGLIMNAFPTIREVRVGVNDLAVSVRGKLAWHGAQGYVVDTLFQVLGEPEPKREAAAVSETGTQPAARSTSGHPTAKPVSDADMVDVDGAVE